MRNLFRRDFLKSTTAVAGAALGSALLPAEVPPQQLSFKPESGAAMADFIVVDMVAEAATGSSSIQDAMSNAERRAKRYYS